jgi:hypothetical protein
MHSIFKANNLQGLSCTILSFRCPGIQERELYILQGIQAGEEIEVLENKADMAISDFRQAIRGEPRYIFTRKDIDSGVRTVQASQDMHQGGFSAPRRTFYSNNVAFLNLKVYSIQSQDLVFSKSIPFNERLCLDNHRCDPPPTIIRIPLLEERLRLD